MAVTGKQAVIQCRLDRVCENVDLTKWKWLAGRSMPLCTALQMEGSKLGMSARLANFLCTGRMIDWCRTWSGRSAGASPCNTTLLAFLNHVSRSGITAPLGSIHADCTDHWSRNLKEGTFPTPPHFLVINCRNQGVKNLLGLQVARLVNRLSN